MEKPAFYLFEKKIIRTFFYKVYVDGHRLYFAKLPYLKKQDVSVPGGASLLEFIVGLLVAMLLNQQSHHRFRRQLAQRERLERLYDEWSQTEKKKLLNCKHHFAIDLKEAKKVVFMPTSHYDSRKGMIQFIFQDETGKTFFFTKTTKLERLEKLLREAHPNLFIEKKLW